MKLVTIKKRKVLLSLLFICFVWFGYITLGFGDKTPAPSDVPEETGEDIGQVKEEVQETGVILDGLSDSEENIALGNAALKNQDDYFVNYRIEREKIRSQQVEILREIVDNPNSVTEVRKEAQEKMLAMTQNMESELKLENLIKAKNFQDAVVLIQPESVMVVVKVLELAEEDGTKIADLVSNTTGHHYEDIIITTKE